MCLRPAFTQSRCRRGRPGWQRASRGRAAHWRPCRPAIVGNFGGGRFFDYTAYGDTINVAARLEAANKQLGLADKVKDFRGRPIGDLILRGKTEPLRVLEPLSQQYNDPATKSYMDAFAKLEASEPDAIAAFAAHVGKLPKDRLASFHLKRLLNGATGTRITME
jgi:adenylate cyclase